MANDILIDGLCFGEGPRWRDGSLWLSDMHDRKVIRICADGVAETILTLEDDEPSGLGWLPDGELLVVSMKKRQILRFDGQSISVHADLSGLASCHCNDMVVDPGGRAYVGNFGFDLFTKGVEPRPAEVIRIDPDGAAFVEDDESLFPNGMVVTPDGRTLIVAESFGRTLNAYDIGNDGSLSNKRLWAKLPMGSAPDGICLDTEGGVWVAATSANACLRVIEGGEITHRVDVDRTAIACTLGGQNLYVIASTTSVPEICRANRDSLVEVHPAPYPGTGSP